MIGVQAHPRDSDSLLRGRSPLRAVNRICWSLQRSHCAPSPSRGVYSGQVGHSSPETPEWAIWSPPRVSGEELGDQKHASLCVRHTTGCGGDQSAIRTGGGGAAAPYHIVVLARKPREGTAANPLDEHTLRMTLRRSPFQSDRQGL